MTLEELEKSALDAIKNAATRESIEQIRIHYLGRKGELTNILRSLKDLSIEEKKSLGSKANARAEAGVAPRNRRKSAQAKSRTP